MGRAATGPWFRKGRGWYYTVGGRDFKLGIKPTASKRAATTAWAALGTHPPPLEGLTLKLALQSFLGAKERGSRSWRDYGFRLGAFVKWRGADTLVATLIANDATKFLADRPTWGATMRASWLRHAKAWLNWLVGEGLIDRNPFASKRAAAGKRREYVLTRSTFEVLLDRCLPDLAAILYALWHTGARPSELCGARGSHVAGCAVVLPTGKQSRGERVRPRRITFPSDLGEWLARFRDRAGDDGFLFPSLKGGGWSVHRLANEMQAAREAAGLPAECTPYALRHSWVSRNVVAGVPLGVIAEQCGTSISMISQRYAHLQPSDVDGWRDRMV